MIDNNYYTVLSNHSNHQSNQAAYYLLCSICKWGKSDIEMPNNQQKLRPAPPPDGVLAGRQPHVSGMGGAWFKNWGG